MSSIFPVRLEGISEKTKQEYTCYAKQIAFYGKTMSDKKVIWNEGQDIAKAPDEIHSEQPMTSLFEQSLLLFGDTTALMLVREKHLELDKLWEYHANLE